MKPTLESTEKLSLLLVENEKNIRQMLAVSLQGMNCDVTEAIDGEEGFGRLKTARFDLVLTDVRLGGKTTGLDVLKAARKLQPRAVVIVMTAFAAFENAVAAIKEGAFDYLPKPFTNAQLGHLIAKAQKIVELQREIHKLKSRRHRSDYFLGMSSPAMVRLEALINKVADTDATILMTGESGTGKSELAAVIHDRSSRRAAPFIVVNCTSLAESLLESELFGHVKGAFTGATVDREGKFETANGGTLFLDEIGDLSAGGQAKLLRFLQERVIERVGSNKAIAVDARVIAATNKNLEEAVRSGKFREDLYYRLNVFECSIVPLRHRREDVPVLIERFIQESAARAGRDAPALSSTASQRLNAYSWPGNVRELRNVIERLVILSAGIELHEANLPSSVLEQSTVLEKGGVGVFSTLEAVERDQIKRVLAVEKNQERAADILGITSVTLWRKRKQYGLP